MNKLIELLNEYEEEGIIFDEVDDEECFVDVHPCTLWTEYNGHLWFNNANKVQFDKWMFDRVAISKDYGFIKWLVDNDKIDHKIYEDMKFTAIKQGVLIDKKSGSTAQETREIIKNGCIDAFIALLAIQDEPIEFLISILK